MKKELPTHYCRTDRELRSWCGLSLAGDRPKRWNYSVEGVTCKRCLRAIEKYKTLDKLPDMFPGVSKEAKI